MGQITASNWETLSDEQRQDDKHVDDFRKESGVTAYVELYTTEPYSKWNDMKCLAVVLDGVQHSVTECDEDIKAEKVRVKSIFQEMCGSITRVKEQDVRLRSLYKTKLKKQVDAAANRIELEREEEAKADADAAR